MIGGSLSWPACALPIYADLVEYENRSSNYAGDEEAEQNRGGALHRALMRAERQVAREVCVPFKRPSFERLASVGVETPDSTT